MPVYKIERLEQTKKLDLFIGSNDFIYIAELRGAYVTSLLLTLAAILFMKLQRHL